MTRNRTPTARPATRPGGAAAVIAPAVIAPTVVAPAAFAAAPAAVRTGDERTATANGTVRTAPRAVCLALVAALIAPFAGAGASAPPAAARDAPKGAALDVRPVPAPAAGPLAAWHRRYLPHAAPVRTAMKRLLAARRSADPTDYKRRYRYACRALGEALAPFEDPERRDALFPAAAADPAAHYHLRRAYAGLSRAAAAGAEGRFEAAELAFAEAAGWFRQAARVLERYGLEP